MGNGLEPESVPQGGRVVVRQDAPHPLPAPPILAGDLLALFLAGRKATTVRAYHQDLADLARFLTLPDADAAINAIVACSQGDANAWALAWRADMASRPLAPATIARRLAALRSVVKLARTIGRVAWTLDVEAPRIESYRDTAGPGRAGVDRMIDAVRAQDDTPTARRDLAVVRLLHDRALRRGELVAMDLADYDPDGPTVAIVGKGRSHRERLTIGAGTARAIERWIEVRGREPGPLFVSLASNARRSSPLTGESVRLIVAKVAASAGLPGCRPHGLRHSALTSALDSGSDIRDVQSFSRHKDIKTLMIYDDRRRDVGGEIARRMGTD